MQKLLHKGTALTIAVLLILTLFAGCGASSSESASYDAAGAAEMPMEEAITEEAAAEEAGFDGAYTYTEDSAEVNTEPAQSDIAEKIIYSGYLYIETTEFDQGLTALEAMVKQYGGFIESSDVSGYTTTDSSGATTVVDRYACYVIRIPCDRFEDCMSQAGTIGNVVNNSRSAENITSQYTDAEAYLDSLEVQEERLLAMLEQATDVDTLVALEARLSEVRYEIDSTTRQLRNWQNQVDYSTVTVNLQEVAVYTPTGSTTRTFGERLADAFEDGWRSFGRTVENLLVGLIAIWPALILLAVIVVVIVVLVKRSNKKAAQRHAALLQAQQQQQQQAPAENDK